MRLMVYRPMHIPERLVLWDYFFPLVILGDNTDLCGHFMFHDLTLTFIQLKTVSRDTSAHFH